MSTRDPINQLDLARVRAADAVLAAAQRWEIATRGCSPNRAAQMTRDAEAVRALRLAVREMRREIDGLAVSDST